MSTTTAGDTRITVEETTPGHHTIRFDPPLTEAEATELARGLEAPAYGLRVAHLTRVLDHGVRAVRTAGFKATQHEFAHRFGYSLRQVQRLEAASRNPHRDSCRRSTTR
jgi:hypothetical protein